MTLSIPLSADLEAQLRARAAAAGQDVMTFAREVIEEKLRIPLSFAEILAPIHAATSSLGMSADDLDTLIEECRNDVFAEKHGKTPL
jgi:hypothetical protein